MKKKTCCNKIQTFKISGFTFHILDMCLVFESSVYFVVCFFLNLLEITKIMHLLETNLKSREDKILYLSIK